MNLQEFCERCDKSRKEVLKLDELSDYLKGHKEDYEPYELRFMVEHLGNCYKYQKDGNKDNKTVR